MNTKRPKTASMPGVTVEQEVPPTTVATTGVKTVIPPFSSSQYKQMRSLGS
jgi:hypothetical protein